MGECCCHRLSFSLLVDPRLILSMDSMILSCETFVELPNCTSHLIISGCSSLTDTFIKQLFLPTPISLPSHCEPDIQAHAFSWPVKSTVQPYN